ncbi:MAG: UDP-N-acetylmuramoyl-L-alanine--D-glutamate ligase [Candidatus Vogelbacteria bacterium]|nr:UDP-N-acetylmuramoyl-L-alanine--D-glutamate ligase [Candidatus Vogelbacteria bacterium]
MDDSFLGKRFTIMGMDGGGRGLKDARFLLLHGVEVIGTDLRKAEEFPEAVALAKQHKNLRLVFGEHRLTDFQNRDFIIRAAKTPIDSPYLAEARKNNIPVVSDETLFLTYAPQVLTVGVTGTRGKTTVTYMIHEILKIASGTQVGTVCRVYLGGNVQDTAMLPLLDKIKDGDYLVMELDSWKLQSFAENKISPNIAVFTTFYRDHMDYYNGDMDRYWLDKSAIFVNQKKGDRLIVSSQVKNYRSPCLIGRQAISTVSPMVVGTEYLPIDWKLKILGDHNRLNAGLALAMARSLDIPDEISRKALESFNGVPGRLEYLGEKNGVKYFNDTASTSPEGTIAGLNALKDYRGKIILIGGGSDKGFEYGKYADEVKQYVRSLILFRGSASDKILKILGDDGVVVDKNIGSMSEAFSLAQSVAGSGDVILLSPGAASFGIFKNEYDRGAQFNRRLNLLGHQTARKIYFVGIGGIGISAIARMMLLDGKTVSGTDASESPVTEELAKLGAKINIEHRAGNITEDINLVVYSIAVTPSNPELVRARELGLLVMSYPEILAEVTKNYFTVAVSGTHGKTTTTAMIAKILIDAGLDPTVIVGSLLHERNPSMGSTSSPQAPSGRGTNFIAGKGKILVLEADEYRRTFMKITPRLVVITNIDVDHLDYYKDLDDIKSVFRSFALKLGSEDHLVCDIGQKNLFDVYGGLDCKVLNYGEICRPDLIVPGEHNRDNARAAIATAIALGVSEDNARKSLETFSGTWRRLEKKGSLVSGVIIYDDYAHNPGKIKAAIAGLRELYPDKKITVVFMPHLFSRTKILLHELAESLSGADRVYVTDIYAARELSDPTIHARDLVDAINVKQGLGEYLGDLNDFAEKIKTRLSGEDVLVTMGAGDIYKLGEKILKFDL